VGEELMNLPKGTIKYLNAFTSTSKDISVAKSFANVYVEQLREAGYKGNVSPHLFHYKLLPGSGLPVAKYAGFSENEILLKFGTKIQYDESTMTTDGRYMVHHCTVFPVEEARTLEHYGTYHHPNQS
jgi:hypothetical protein